MDQPGGQEKIILKLKVAADETLLAATARCIAETAAGMGLDKNDAPLLETAVREAGKNVIQYAFGEGEAGEFDILLSQRPGQLVVAVEDRGLPMDIERIEAGGQSGMGLAAMNAFADEVRFLNLGNEGKRVELIKNLNIKSVNEYLTPEEKRGVFTGTVPDEKVPTVCRPLSPEEVVSLSRCLYRSYGYSYFSDFYYPDKIRQMLESGRLLSVVMNDNSGEVVAHLAIMLSSPAAKIGDLGQGVVNPEYRGKGLANVMVTAVLAQAKQKGLYGYYCEAVTAHPFSQKALLSLGGHEIGLPVGYVPEEIANIGLAQEKRQRRQSIMLMYGRLNEEPKRLLFFPEQHYDLLSRIYGNLALNRTITGKKVYTTYQKALPERAKLNITLNRACQHTTLFVTQYGLDIVDHVRVMLREACLHGNACVYLDLPLSDPATPAYCAALESLGFFFLGVVPELHDGDVLRLQYLNNVEVEWDKIAAVSDFSRELLEYVKSAHARAFAEDIEMTKSRIINLEMLRSGKIK